jgi:hypothetical protein
MAFTKITAAGIGSTETVTLDGVAVINNESIGGNLTVTGNATIGGVLTYEDVTNVDSVGVITARAGVLVGSGITLSKDGDIFATGVTTSTTFVGNLTGNVTGNSDTATNSTNASHVLVTDNESTNENNLITFVEDATSSTGNVGLEMDGNFTYNPSTGTVSATAFSGSGANLTNIDSGMFIKTSAGIHTVGDQSNVGIGTTNPASGLDVSLKTDGIALPEGTTSQRPSGSQKFIRFNSTTGSLELYNGNQWVEILSDYSQTGSTGLG